MRRLRLRDIVERRFHLGRRRDQRYLGIEKLDSQPVADNPLLRRRHEFRPQGIFAVEQHIIDRAPRDPLAHDRLGCSHQ